MIKDSTLSMASRFTTAIGKFVAYIVIARAVSIEGFGEYSLLLTISTIITIVSLFGYNNAIINVNARFKSKSLANSSSVIYTLFLATGIFIIILLVSSLLSMKEISFYFAILTFSQIIYSNGMGILIANSKLTLVFYSSLITNSLFLSLCLLSNSVDYKIYILYFALTNLIILFFYIKYIDLSYRFRHIKRIIKLQLNYGKNYLSVEINDVIHHRFDILLIKLFLGDHAVGLYSMVKNIFEGVMYIPKALRPIIIKEISRKKEIPYQNIIFIYSVLYIIGVILLLFFGKWLIMLTYGSIFSEAYIPLVIVLIGGYFYSIAFINSSFYMGLNKFKYSVTASVITSVSIVIMGLILIPIIGINGASFAFLISSLIYLVYSFKYIGLIQLIDGKGGI